MLNLKTEMADDLCEVLNVLAKCKKILQNINIGKQTQIKTEANGSALEKMSVSLQSAK